jgi:alpha-L-fucosidase 2
MKASIIILHTALFFAAFAFANAEGYAQPAHRLWYDKPATSWNEALPIGNGKLAAMLFGEPTTERVQLNEETIWAGGPHNNIIPGSAEVVSELRRLLFEKKFEEAQKLSLQRMQPVQNGMPYLPAGNLFIAMDGHEKATNYRRELDIDSALYRVSYTVNEVTYLREAFATNNGNHVRIRLTANTKNSINCRAFLQLPYSNLKRATDNNCLTATATARGHEKLDGAIKYQVSVLPLSTDGKIRFTDTSVSITNASVVDFIIMVTTNFGSYNKIFPDNFKAGVDSLLRSEAKRNYAEARALHIRNYQRYMKRVQLDLGDNTAASSLPTDIRLKNFNTGNDPQLVTLYFQFGRYLLISSSAPNGQPATLQGKWNDRVDPPWDSKYTININTEMNYWPAEPTALAELSGPLFAMVRDLSITGQEAAKKMYGARGWVTHHNTDIWRMSGPVDGGFYGVWPMGGAWLCRHLWEHYLYTGDQKFLRAYYPVLKGAVLFYVDALRQEPDHQWLVMAPSMSPENHYMEYRDGDRKQQVSLTAGATMDNQIIFELFSSYLRAASVLKMDNAFADTVRIKRDQLAPMQIGQYGQLQEWMYDWDKPDDKHRHISHLYGLYPSYQVTPNQSPELFEAARNTLVSRGDVSTGWSMGWKVNFWARMLDGNRAYKLISDQLTPAVLPDGRETGGTYNNLFDAHPPFQIDGNFGCTAGIAEMLLQSHDGAIEILPALPDSWQQGKITGLKARGGFTVDIEWAAGKLKQLTIHAALGGNFRLRTTEQITNAQWRKASSANPNTFYKVDKIKKPLVSPKAKLKGIDIKKKFEYDLQTTAGKKYRFNF